MVQIGNGSSSPVLSILSVSVHNLAQQQCHHNRGDDCYQPRQHETVIEQILSDLCRAGLIERDRSQQRPVSRQEKDSICCRIQRSQRSGG